MAWGTMAWGARSPRNLGELEHRRVGGEHRRGQPRDREAVAARIDDDEPGSAPGGVRQDGGQILRLRHGGSEIGEGRLRKLDRVRARARGGKAVDRFGAEACAEDELLAPA